MDTSSRTTTHASALLFVLVVTLALGAASLIAAAPARAVLPAPGNLFTWASFDGYAHTTDQFRDAVRGPGGSVFACGIDSMGDLTSNMLLVKYDTAGGKVWSAGGRPDSALSAEAYAVAVNAQGAAAVAGRAWNGSNDDWCVFKVNAAGGKVWWATKAGAANDYDSAGYVALDRGGNVIAGGDLDNGTKAVAVKYAAAADPAHPQTGRRLWTNTVKAPAGGEAYTDGLVVDGSGNVYVTGQRTAANGHDDIYVRKIRPGGKTVWTRWWDGRSHGDDAPYGIVLRGDRLFVSGKTAVPGHMGDLLLLRYTTVGRLVWKRTWDDSAHLDDVPWDLAVDGHGNAYLLGQAEPTPSTHEGLLVKWSATGVRRWARIYTGSGGGGARFDSLQVASNGTAWVSGLLQSGSNPQALVLKYGAAGTQMWVFTYVPPGCSNAELWTSALSGTNCLFAAGFMHKNLSNDDALGVWVVR